MYCNRCKSFNEVDTKYCHNCGNSLINDNSVSSNNKKQTKKNKGFFLIVIALLLILGIFVFYNSSHNNVKKNDTGNSNCAKNNSINSDHKSVSFKKSYKKGDIIEIGGTKFVVEFTSNIDGYYLSANHGDESNYVNSNIFDVLAPNKQFSVSLKYNCKDWYFKSDANDFESNIDTNMLVTPGNIFVPEYESAVDSLPAIQPSQTSFILSKLYYTEGDIKVGNVTLKRDKKGYLWFSDNHTFNINNANYAKLQLQEDEDGFVYANVSYYWKSAVNDQTFYITNSVDAEGYSYGRNGLLEFISYD